MNEEIFSWPTFDLCYYLMGLIAVVQMASEFHFTEIKSNLHNFQLFLSDRVHFVGSGIINLYLQQLLC